MEIDMATLTTHGRNGVLTRIRIDGITDAEFEKIQWIVRRTKRDGSTVTGEGSKADIVRISAILAQMAPVAPVAAPQTARRGQRRIELACRTDGLNTGRPWVADGFTIDRHSLPPEWEGQRVCYVYE